MSALAPGEPAELDLLHHLRVRGIAPADSLAADAKILAGLERAGLIVQTERGCLLSEGGHRRHQTLLDAERERIPLRVIEAAYGRFLALNRGVKGLCSRWQRLAAGAAAERLAVIEELRAVLERIEPALERAARLVPRFAEYRERLRAVVAALEAGDHRRVTDPGVDSFHSIWFECHEDFLLTLGREREAEDGD